MFAAIAWILISKHLMRRHSAVMVTASVFWIGTVMLAVVVITNIRRSFAAIFDPRMDCRRGAGIARYREHNSVVELGTQAGSGISSRNFRKSRTASRRDSRCRLATQEFGA
jgi:hypothetical protein